MVLAAVGTKDMEEASDQVRQTLEQAGYDLSDGYEVIVSGSRRQKPSGKFRDEKEDYQITVSGRDASILIGGEEKKASEEGISFVVYDLNHLAVVERVSFSTKDGSVAARESIY